MAVHTTGRESSRQWAIPFVSSQPSHLATFDFLRALAIFGLIGFHIVVKRLRGAVLQCTLTLITETQGHRHETQLHPLDSVAIAPHESRQLFNHSPHEARVLLAMPMPARLG